MSTADDRLMMDPHRRERRRFERGEIRDRVQQTHVHYDHEKGEMSLLSREGAGAYEHVSVYEDALRN